MCGIAGVLSRRPSVFQASMLESLGRALAHRGPDDQGYLISEQSGVTSTRQAQSSNRASAALVHQRLSILDLSSAGWQPMSSEDNRFHLVYNGEIYNYIELRDKLAARGTRFRSKSDSEVLLALLMQEGVSALSRLAGMFSFALLDQVERRVLLARDPFGIKPLYFSCNDATFAFASELKALLTLPWIGRTVNASPLYDYVRYGVTDHGDETLLAGVRQLPAAHYLMLPLDGPWSLEPVRYWDPSDVKCRRPSFSQAAEEVRARFLDSVRLHLRSDVPVGAALSGGIDSSAIVMGARHVAGAGAEIHAFSYVAGEGAVNEERYADLVAAAGDLTMHKVHLCAQDLGRDVERLIAVQDFPFASTSIFAQYRVFQAARECGIPVMLDGQGADELLGGYQYFVSVRVGSLLRQGQWREAASLLRHAVARPGDNRMTPSLSSGMRIALGGGAFLMPDRLQAGLQTLVGRSPAPRWLNARWFEERGVRPRSMHFEGLEGPDVLRGALRRALVQTSLPQLLRYEDRNSMAWSIESRVPFLTTDLASCVLSLPEEYLVDNRATTKAVFRAAMRGIVPDAVLDRRDKVGFSTPESAWMTGLTPWVDALWNDARAITAPLFNYDVMQEMWRRRRAGEGGNGSDLWRWCNLLAWARQLDVTLA